MGELEDTRPLSNGGGGAMRRIVPWWMVYESICDDAMSTIIAGVCETMDDGWHRRRSQRDECLPQEK